LAAGLVYSAAAVVGIGATVAMLLAGLGLRALPAGLLVRSAVLLLGNLGAMVAWLRSTRTGWPRLDRAELRAVARLSGFSFLSRVGGALVGRLDALLCATMLSPTVAAVFTLTGRAFDPVRMAAERIPAALAPGLAHLAGSGHRRRLAEVTGAVWTVAGLVLAAGVGAVVALDAVFVRLWVGPALFGGAWLAFAIGAAVTANVLANGMNQVVFSLGGIRPASMAGLSEGLARLTLQVVLVPFLGVMGMPLGALFATLATSAWYLPSAAAVLMGEPRSAALRRWWLALVRALLLASLGLGLSLTQEAWGLRWSWPRFAAAAAVLGVALGGWAAWRGWPAVRAVRARAGPGGAE
jgi:O-antigen/teichoic acid export membrane protein